MSQFTKKAIIVSFMKLLEQKPLDKITVKDIVQDCGVNRGTFYYYYQDIVALIDDIFLIETNKVLKETDGFNSWKEGFIQSTKFALQNKKIIYHAYNSVNREQLENYLYKTTFNFIKEYVDLQAKDLYVSEEDKLFVAKIYHYALVGMTLEWIGNGMKENAEIHINKMEKLFGGSIRQTLIKSDSRNATKI